VTGEILLSCDTVSKHYGSLAAVDALSFSVAAGEVYGIGGPNGAGKTTLFDVITGLSPATGGRVVFAGQDITRAGADRICQLGVARTFQLNAAFDGLTVRENVEVASYFGHGARSMPGLRMDRASRRRAMEALEFVGMAGAAERPATSITVLERKLLMIAGAVATGPRLVLLDEPVGGLTPGEIDRVMQVVRRLVAGGVTVILIEHVMRFLLALSTRVMIMHHGGKLFEGAPEGVAEDDEVRRTYLGDATTARLKTFFQDADAKVAHA
jgi:branched-chain amino acid transport system ATP-binding protein